MFLVFVKGGALVLIYVDAILGMGGVLMMSQAQKYLWIIVAKYWGYVIFAHWCSMFSENDHSCRSSSGNYAEN
jgi:hypothetical protein